MQTSQAIAPAALERYETYASFMRSRYFSTKHSSYFQVYEELLARFRNSRVTFVEVGVFNGGSLFMWRDYLGPAARIIGIDLNPLAKKWEADGFEIHIGDQADPEFWAGFFAHVGDVDVLLDDGGHTNEQQVITAHHCIPRIRNGGLLIVEDTHASYLKAFWNPSRYSFVSYAKRMIDRIHARNPEVLAQGGAWEKSVYSMSVYESIVCFRIDREKCFVSSPTMNGGISSEAKDFRHQRTGVGKIRGLQSRLREWFGFLRRIGWVRRTQRFVFDSVISIYSRYGHRRLKKYFS